MERITHAMRRERWQAIIKECNESGMAKKDWLAMHNINPKVFYRWQKRLRMENGTEYMIASRQAALEPVPQMSEFQLLEPPQSSGSSAPVTVRKNDICIEISEDITNEFLLKIMKVLAHV